MYTLQVEWICRDPNWCTVGNVAPYNWGDHANWAVSNLRSYANVQPDQPKKERKKERQEWVGWRAMRVMCEDVCGGNKQGRRGGAPPPFLCGGAPQFTCCLLVMLSQVPMFNSDYNGVRVPTSSLNDHRSVAWMEALKCTIKVILNRKFQLFLQPYPVYFHWFAVDSFFF